MSSARLLTKVKLRSGSASQTITSMPGDEVAEPLLALAERVLGGLAAADVDHEPLCVERAAGLVADDDGPVVHPDDVPVARDQPVLAFEAISPCVHLHEVGENALAVFRVEHAAEERGVGDPLLRRVADHLLDLRADVRRALPVELLDVRHLRKLLDEHAVPLLGQAELLLERHTPLLVHPGPLARDREE